MQNELSISVKFMTRTWRTDMSFRWEYLRVIGNKLRGCLYEKKERKPIKCARHTVLYFNIRNRLANY